MDILLSVTAFDQLAKHREFSCQLESLEACFRFLNHFVASGNTLLTAYMLDSNGRTDLPVDAFDGMPVSLAFDSMQEEWEAVLSDSQPTVVAHYQDLLLLTRHRLMHCEQRILYHQEMICQYECWIQQTLDSHLLEPLQIRILGRYRLQLESRQVQLDTARFQSTLLIKRLNHLSALVS